jgi:uncharacterized protein (TIGR01777 family)
MMGAGNHVVISGFAVSTLVRRPPANAREIEWREKLAFPEDLRADAIVHLAGEPVMGIWTAEKKRRIRDSRVLRTRELAELLARREPKPRVLVCASAIGYYGDRGDKVLTESSPPGTGFLAENCVAWEAATSPAKAAGIRVVNLRIGVVLSRKGGALKAMLPAFRLGLGARLGDGQQWMSWIALADLIRIIEFAIEQETLAGPVNCTAPNPVTNGEFSKTLASVLHRPTFLPVPKFLAKLAPGGMGKEALLASERVMPEKLQNAGFEFTQLRLREALESILR